MKLGNFVVRSKDGNTFIYIQMLEAFEDYPSKIGDPVSILTPKENDEEIPQKKIKIEERYSPIASLNPFQSKWTIRGTVLSKTDVRVFNNQKGEGKCFSLELADETQQVKVTCFTDVVDIFFPVFEVGQVFSVSKGTVKMANKQYSSNNFDYEIHLDRSSEVHKINDEIKRQINFEFVKIGDINMMMSNLVDVVALVKESFQPTTIVIKTTQKESSKRDLILIDETGNIRMTMWGQKTELDYENNPVIAIKNAKIGEYNGVKTISSIATTQVFLNPDMDRAFELKGWFADRGKDIKIEMPKRSEKHNFIREIKDNEMEYSYFLGSFMFIKDDSLFYESCISDKCNKKVTKEEDGRFRCEKCNKVFDYCNYRYLMTVNIGDFSGNLWANLFNEVGSFLFSMNAEELKESGENNPDHIQKLIRKLQNEDFGIKIRGKQDFYNNEPRMKYTIMECSTIDYVKESRRILEDLNKNLV